MECTVLVQPWYSYPGTLLLCEDFSGPSVRSSHSENLKRRSPFISLFYVGWEVPREVFFVINLVRLRYAVRPVS